MAKFNVSGLDGLQLSLTQMAQIPHNVKVAMLDAEAAVIIPAHKSAAPKDTGTLQESITGGPVKTGGSGLYKDVYPRGTHHTYTVKRAFKNPRRRRPGEKVTVRNAEIGFVHNYGAPGRNIPAQKWVDNANKKASGEAVDAARKVYDDWLKSLNL